MSANASDNGAAPAAPDDGYDPYRPFITKLEYEEGTQPDYQPFSIPAGGHFSPSFALPGGVDPTAAVLNLLFLPDSMIDLLVNSTNSYARSRLPSHKLKVVSRADMLYFLAIYYYMGLVKLPAKRDYWKSSESTVWPHHPVCNMLSRSKYDYIWRNLHLSAVDSEAVAEEEAEEDGAGPDEDDVESVGGDQPLDDDEEEAPAPDERWFAKAGPIIDHLNAISKLVCRHPGFCCSIDEQMKLFKGRASQTHRMKSKPIKEGYKFYTINCAQSGFTYHLVPDGRGEREGALQATTVDLIAKLPRRDNLQYVVGMDNLFTTRHVMEQSRALGVAIVGTARARRGWPPKEIKSVTENRFNALHLLKDRSNFLIARWIDNNVVTMVTTLHSGNEAIKRMRRRPRPTATNRTHIQRVWGTDSIKEIFIPSMIDDYNHWMLGVDKSDQLIAYYRPNIRCRRTWMPLFFHALDCLRVNAFIVQKEMNKDTQVVHKEFIADWIQNLIDRAGTENLRGTRRSSSTISPPNSNRKRRRVSSTNPRLDPARLVGDQSVHHQVLQSNESQKACMYCSYLRAKAKLRGDAELPSISKVTRMCSHCNVHLCKRHFNEYHGWNVAETDQVGV